MSQANHFERVAIAGATGRFGRVFAEELLKTRKHTIKALNRVGSKGNVPEGVKTTQVDYDNEEALAMALRGQQFLVISLKEI